MRRQMWITLARRLSVSETIFLCKLVQFLLSPSHKSDTESLIDSEDDLDDINLNIHLDVINAGKAYLDVFGEKKYKRAAEKLKRKQELMKMITEIE
jgi:hypothetical protein